MQGRIPARLLHVYFSVVAGAHTRTKGSVVVSASDMSNKITKKSCSECEHSSINSSRNSLKS